MQIDSDEDLKKWCEEHLFGPRTVKDSEGKEVRIPLTSTQNAVKLIAVAIIKKWEESKEKGEI